MAPDDLKRILVHLREAHVEELDALAAEVGGSRAQLIRTAITEYLQRERARASRRAS